MRRFAAHGYIELYAPRKHAAVAVPDLALVELGAQMQGVNFVHAVEHAAVNHRLTAAYALLAELKYKPQRHFRFAAEYAREVQKIGSVSIVSASVHSARRGERAAARHIYVFDNWQRVDIGAKRQTLTPAADVAIYARAYCLGLVPKAFQLLDYKRARLILLARKLGKRMQLAARFGKVFDRQTIHG